MFKFFNKTRQNLIVQNRFAQYLLYALGEIVLVVVGILIALNINNANEVSKLRQKEKVLLEEMQMNLQDDMEDLQYNIEGNLLRTKANKRVLEALENKEPMNDSLRWCFGNVYGDYQLSENTASWENLKSIGLDIISDKKLRKNISQLYTYKYKYLENVEKDVDDLYQWNYVYPQVLEHLNVEAMWVSATPENYEALWDDREFKEILKMNLFIRAYVQQRYESLSVDVQDILDQLEIHIQSLKEST